MFIGGTINNSKSLTLGNPR